MYNAYKKFFNECVGENVDKDKIRILNDLFERYNSKGGMTHLHLIDICRTMLGELVEREVVKVETGGLVSGRITSFTAREYVTNWYPIQNRYLEVIGNIPDCEKRANEFNNMLEDLRASSEIISQFDIVEFWHCVLKTFEGTEFEIQFDENGYISKVQRHIEPLTFE